MREIIELSTQITKSARTMQVASMFDYTPGEVQITRFEHDLPIETKPWQIGLIVGPSGGGKSVLARRIWGDLVVERMSWDERAIVENFPREASISEITSTLTAVGFGTVPAWLRSYSSLSNGERFRADMARAMIEATDSIVIDEFTSVVDRQVAKIASHSVQKTIRRGDRQFVAVTCHYDVEDWLQPDWSYDVSTREFSWRLVQPHPEIKLEVRKASRREWDVFSRHHYLSADLASAAQCFVATIDDRPVAFTSYIHFMHPKAKDIKMLHRLVVLPDYQGLGIASRLKDWLGLHLWENGWRHRSVVAHPAMIRMFSRSSRWVSKGGGNMATGPKSQNAKGNLDSRRLVVRSFEYTAPAGVARGRR
jgi:ABC-type lipoprotein export system ATPase subunit/GNAT superfamily N-acetyltransferase